jgi:hypothetical protein
MRKEELCFKTENSHVSHHREYYNCVHFHFIVRVHRFHAIARARTHLYTWVQNEEYHFLECFDKIPIHEY